MVGVQPTRRAFSPTKVANLREVEAHGLANFVGFDSRQRLPRVMWVHVHAPSSAEMQAGKRASGAAGQAGLRAKIPRKNPAKNASLDR